VTRNGPSINLILVAFSTLLLFVLSSCGASDQASSELEKPSVRSLLYPMGNASAANQGIIEDEIQLCMKATGFEYTQQPHEVSERERLPFPTIGSWTVEIAEEFGFSIAQRATLNTFSSYELIQALSESERQAWIEASFKCRSAAVEQVNGEWVTAIEPIRQDFDDLVAEFNADPAIVQIQLAWSDCMRELGYQDGLSSLRQFGQGYADRFNDHQVRVGPNTRSPEQEIELDELIHAEISGAIDAAQCAELLREKHNELWNDYQADFQSSTEIAVLPGSGS